MTPLIPFRFVLQQVDRKRSLNGREASRISPSYTLCRRYTTLLT